MKLSRAEISLRIRRAILWEGGARGSSRKKIQRVAHGHLRELVDISFPHGHREDLGLQPPAAARLAVLLRHEPFHPFLDLLGAALQVAAPQVVQDPAESRLVLPLPAAVPALVAETDLLFRPPQEPIEN